MFKVRLNIVLAIIFLVTGVPLTLHAEHNMSGELTVDLKRVKLGKIPHQTDSLGKPALDANGQVIPLDELITYSRKTLSSHLLRLNFSGPFISQNFGNYILKTDLSGAFYGNVTEQFRTSDYLNFNLNGVEGIANLFTQKRYPLRLYRNTSTKYSIKDEPSLRTIEETSRIVGLDAAKSLYSASSQYTRRYDAEATSYGGDLMWNVRKNLDFKVAYNNNELDQLRHFDFDEDEIVYVLPEKTSTFRDQDSILFINSLSDASIRVTLGFDFLTILPLDTGVIVVDSGYQDLSISVQSGDYLDPPDTTLYFDTHMEFLIFHGTPPPPNDLLQRMENVNFSLIYDPSKKFKNETVLDVSSMSEVLQILSSDLTTFNNRATYVFNPKTDIVMNTAYSSNSSTIDTLFPQDNTMLNHMSTVTYKARKGLNSTISHSYTKSSTKNGSIGIDTMTLGPDTTLSELRSTNNVFSTNTSIPYSRLDYSLNIKTNINLLSDNSGYENNQYGIEFHNKMVREYIGATFTPKIQTKYLINKSQAVDSLEVNDTVEPWDTLQVFKTPQESKELENKLYLSSEIVGNKYLGDLRITGEYQYRKKFDSVGSDIKYKKILDLFMTKKMSNSAKIIFMSNQEKETYGGSTPSTHIPVASVGSPKQLKSTYKIDFQLAPWDGHMYSVNYMYISQSSHKYNLGAQYDESQTEFNRGYSYNINRTKIKKFGISMNVTIPLIDFPIKMLYLKETRQLSSDTTLTDYVTDFSNSKQYYTGTGSDPDQGSTTFEAVVNYSYRKISLSINYEYSREKQKATSFSFYEVSARISRQFGIY